MQLKAAKIIELFFDCVINKQFKKAVPFCQKSWQALFDDSDIRLQEIFNLKTVKEIQIAEQAEISCLFRQFHVLVFLTIQNVKYKEMWTINLIKESAPYKPDISGTWGINPESIRLVYGEKL